MFFKNFRKKQIIKLSDHNFNQKIDYWYKKNPSSKLSKEKMQSIYEKLKNHGFIYFDGSVYAHFNNIDDYMENKPYPYDLIFDIAEWPDKIFVNFRKMDDVVYEKIKNTHQNDFIIYSKIGSDFNNKTYVHDVNLDDIDQEIDLSISVFNEWRNFHHRNVYLKA
jgi:hypothetical protein